jgi:hypothetical protein
MLRNVEILCQCVSAPFLAGISDAVRSRTDIGAEVLNEVGNIDWLTRPPHVCLVVRAFAKTI